MIQCARCAAANQPTSKYCLTCGAPLPAASPAAAAANAANAANAAAPTAPPPAPAWGPPGYGPPPGHGGAPPGAAPPQPHPSAAGPNYASGPGAPPPQFAGSDAERFRFGSPDGLNPYGATVGPSAQGPGGYAQPPAPVNPHSHEASAFAPTAPPVRDEYDPYRAPAQPAPAAPPGYNPPAAAPHNPPPAPAYNQPPAPAYNQQPAAYAQQQPAPAYPQAPAPAPLGHQPSAPAYAQPAAYGQPPGAGYAAPPGPAAPQAGVQPRPSRPPPSTGRDPDQVEPGAPRALAGFLVSYEGSDLGAFWPIHQGQNQLGRKGAAPGLDIEIDHPTTSSRHAVLYASARPARLKLEDSGSTNGTFLRDQQLERGRRYEVEDGDVVRFGGFTTIVKLV